MGVGCWCAGGVGCRWAGGQVGVGCCRAGGGRLLVGSWEQVGSVHVGRRGGGDTDILLHRASKKCLHTLFASAAKVPQLHPAPDLRLRGHARDPLTGLGPGLGARLPGLPRHPRLDIPSARPQRPHSPGQEIKPPSNHSGSRATDIRRISVYRP